MAQRVRQWRVTEGDAAVPTKLSRNRLCSSPRRDTKPPSEKILIVVRIITAGWDPRAARGGGGGRGTRSCAAQPTQEHTNNQNRQRTAPQQVGASTRRERAARQRSAIGTAHSGRGRDPKRHRRHRHRRRAVGHAGASVAMPSASASHPRGSGVVHVKREEGATAREHQQGAMPRGGGARWGASQAAMHAGRGARRRPPSRMIRRRRGSGGSAPCRHRQQ